MDVNWKLANAINSVSTMKNMFVGKFAIFQVGQWVSLSSEVSSALFGGS